MNDREFYHDVTHVARGAGVVIRPIHNGWLVCWTVDLPYGSREYFAGEWAEAIAFAETLMEPKTPEPVR